MKAIEKLENINVWGDVTQIQEQIDEVIAELEELEILENRGCNSCKYEKVVECERCNYCKTNCLDRWESK